MSTPKSIRDNIIVQASNMLACYRKNCAQASAAGQLILPETLKLLPVYIASLIKSDVLIGSMFKITISILNIKYYLYLAQTITTDDRSWLMHRVMSMNIKGTLAYLYPRIYPLVCTDY